MNLKTRFFVFALLTITILATTPILESMTLNDTNISIKSTYSDSFAGPLSQTLVTPTTTKNSNEINLFYFLHHHPRFIRPLKQILPYLAVNSIHTDDTEYWGLLIAVGEYLNNPNQDRPSMLVEVENLYQSLVSKPNWEPSHIRKIKGEQANLNNILDGFRWLLKMEDGNDISLIYITTHGSSMDQDLPPKDEADGKDEILFPYEAFDDNTKIIWDDEINLFCSLLQSKGICLIVDSCHSGGFNDKVSITDHTIDQWQNGFMDDLKTGFRRVILMSSKEEELSYGSQFTHYIAQGFQGGANMNQDKSISAEEVFEYAEPFVSRYDRQQPTILDLFQGDLSLIELS